MRIDLDQLNHDEVFLDHLGRIVARVQFVEDIFILHIEEVVDSIQFFGNGKGKNFTIHAKIPCSFTKNQWNFSQLLLMGGPYEFIPGSHLSVETLEIDGQSIFTGSHVIAQKTIQLLGPSSIQETDFHAAYLFLNDIRAMHQVQLHAQDEDSVCDLTLSSEAFIEDVKVKTKDLIFNSHADDVVELKTVHASFSRLGIGKGQYHFIDSQLQDDLQTKEQWKRFSQGLSSYQFHAWHRAQEMPRNEENDALTQEILGHVQLTHSTLLTSAILAKRESAKIYATAGSVVAAQEFHSQDDSILEEDNPSLVFSDSLFVSQVYFQSQGRVVLKHSAWCVSDTLFARDNAAVSLSHESYLSVGNEINLNNANWDANRSTISSKTFSAYANSHVNIEDVSRPLSERQVRWKADKLSSDCSLHVRNIVARFSSWGHLGSLKYDNFSAIVDREVFASQHSQMQGNQWVLQSGSVYLNGAVETAESTFLVARDACVIGEKGNILLRGKVMGRFTSWNHLGNLHVARSTESDTSLFSAQTATLHKGSKIAGDFFGMDVDNVTLLGEINLEDHYRLLTQSGILKGKIQSKGSIDLAADYLLKNLGAQFYARDVRVVGNYLSFLGEVQAQRSYSRVGGLILDTDLVLANNIMTTALVSASFGVKLPNPTATLDDFFALNNLMRAGLTVLNLTLPSVSPLANAAYFFSKLALASPAFSTLDFKQLRRMRPHQWMSFLSYASAFGFSGYQEFAHFHLEQDSVSSFDFETVATRLLPAFISGEMNSSLILLNSGLNLLPSSLNNALFVEDAGVTLHMNDSVNALIISHSGVDVAIDRVETVEYEETQGMLVSRLRTLFAHHWHLTSSSHEYVTERAEGKVIDLNNEGTLSIESSKHDSVLNVDQWDNKNKIELTGVTVEGLQFTSRTEAGADLHDVVFHNKIHVDNGHTSYTGYYVVETKHYTHTGDQSALDAAPETVFSLVSDDAEFQGIIHNNQVHLEIKNIKNIKDFLEGKGSYANYHVATALELVTQQALELHGLRQDCDISITAPGLHFNQDQNFTHNVSIHSSNAMTIDHDIRSSKYLYVEANGNVVLRSPEKDPANLFEEPSPITIAATESAYIKSDHGEVIGQGVHAQGKLIAMEAEKNITLDKNQKYLPDFSEFSEIMNEKMLHGDLTDWSKGYVEFLTGKIPETPTELEGQQILLESHEGNVLVNGEEKANDTIQIVADKGHVTVEGVLASGDQVNVIADTGFDLLSKRHLKQTYYKAEWNPSEITAGEGGVHIEVKNGDAVIDSSDILAKGVITIEANTIDERAHTSTHISDVEEHKGFLGFHSHKTITQTTNVFRSHLSSDSKIILQAHDQIHSEGAAFQGKQGTYLLANHDIRLDDVVGHTHVVDESSSFFGLTHDKTMDDQEFNISTSIVDSTEINMQSKSGDVVSVGSELVSPNATVSGENTLFYGRILNNQSSHETRGLHVSIADIPIFSSHSTHRPFEYHNTTVNNAQRLLHSHDVTEAVLNTTNLGIDLYNTGESVASSVAHNNFSAPDIEIGLERTHQSYSYQTLGDGGIHVGHLTVNAHNRALFSGLPVNVEGDAVIHARTFDQFGVSLNAQYSSNSQDIAVGFSQVGFDYADFNASQSFSQSQRFVNEEFLVGGHLEVDATNWTLENANVDARSLTAHVAGTLTEKTEVGTTKTHSMSVQIGTLGDVGVNASEQHEQNINKVSSIHTHDDSTIDAHAIQLSGAKITADGKVNVTADTISGEDVQTHSHGDNVSAGGNIHSFWHHATETNTKHIDTFSVSDSGSRENETQRNVIHGAEGTIINARSINGSVDTSDSDGHTTDRDQHWDYQADIPVTFESGDRFASSPPSDAAVTQNTVASPNHTFSKDDNIFENTINSLDFSEESIVINPQTFEERSPELMPENAEIDNYLLNAAYANALMGSPTENIFIYDVNRQAARNLYGRPVLDDDNLMTLFSDSSFYRNIGKVLLNELQGILDLSPIKSKDIMFWLDQLKHPEEIVNEASEFFYGQWRELEGFMDASSISEETMFWLDRLKHPKEVIEALEPLLDKADQFLYDQINEAENLLSCGYFGDPDSVARNEQRSEVLIHYFSKLLDSQFGTENQGYLLAQTALWLTPGVDCVEAAIVGVRMGRAALLAARGLFSQPVVESGIGLTSRLTRADIIHYLSHVETIPREELIRDIKSLGLVEDGSEKRITFVCFHDRCGRTRAMIHGPHPRGAKYHHLHIYDKHKNPLDAQLKVLWDESPDVHIRIQGIPEEQPTIRSNGL